MDCPKNMPIKYSLVIPLKNEEENIKELLTECKEVMKEVACPFEILCIDDGSTDNTLEIVRQAQVRYISFDKNYGQSAAFAVGFQKAKGKFVITLDGDGQNNPHDIPKLLAAIDNADLAVGRRIARQDPWHKKIISKLSNRVRRSLCKDGVHDTGCSLKIYRKEALQKIKMFKGMHRFLPALFIVEKLRVCEIPVSHRERKHGKTNYHFFNRSIGPFLDMLAVYWMRKKALHPQIQEEK